MPPPAEDNGPPTGRPWVIKPGDSFWSIAVAALSAPGQPPPSEAAVARYWVRLIAANKAALPHPGDPDLLFPGDVVTLPPAQATGPPP